MRFRTRAARACIIRQLGQLFQQLHTHGDVAQTLGLIRLFALDIQRTFEAYGFQFADKFFHADRTLAERLFYTERAGYDPHYGAVEPARSHWINRHNLWQRSHRLDGEEPVRCTTDEECADGRGSVCDMQWARAHQETEGLCTLAYRDREIEPVVYYASLGFPQDLLQTAETMVVLRSIFRRLSRPGSGPRALPAPGAARGSGVMPR